MTLWEVHSPTTLLVLSGRILKHSHFHHCTSYQNMDLWDSFYYYNPPPPKHTHPLCIFTSFGFNKIIIMAVARTRTCRKLGGLLYDQRGFTDGRHLWNICVRCWVDAPVILVTHVECNPLEKPLTQNTLLSVKCTSLWDWLSCPHRIVRLMWAQIDR